MLSTIVTALVKGLLDALLGWFQKERREAAEWEAKTMKGKLDSIRTADAVELKIESAAPVEHTTTAAAWNAKVRGAALLVLLCFLCVGCFTKYVYVPAKWPTIKVPGCPKVPEDPPEFSPREVILAGYAELLETRIDTYNEAARSHNALHGYIKARRLEADESPGPP